MNVRKQAGCVALLLAVSLLFDPASTWAKGDKGDKKDKKDKDDYISFSKGVPEAEAEAEPGKALVYVLRPAKMGFAIKSWFFCDDDVLGVNKGDSCFAAQVDPGKHVFWSKSENVDAVELSVEAGGTYYIQQRVRMGGFKARTKLDVLTAEEGPEILAKCKRQSSLTDAGRERGAALAAEYREATEKDLERRSRQAEKESK